MALFWAAIFGALLLAALAVQWFKVSIYGAWLLGMTIVTGGVFGADKLMARTRWRRVPELVLWLLILLGGFAGGALGMVVFRHKTRHWMFWLVVVVGFILHGAVGWWL